MRKIPTLFLRDEVSRNKALARNEVNPECAWVVAGEGVATRKWDGTCCLVRNGLLYKRLEWDAKKGTAPEAWLHHDFDPAARSGHGWMPVGPGPEDWMHREVIESYAGTNVEDGTYELLGPRINKNPEGMFGLLLVRHGRDRLDNVPTDFDGLRTYLRSAVMEGIVWHHPDGRMAKIKRRDFDIPWPEKKR